MNIYIIVAMASLGFDAPHSEYVLYNKNGYGYIIGEIRSSMKEITIPKNVKYLFLNSGGGDLDVALRIAEIVREHGIITVNTDVCYSACVVIYEAGSRRLATATATFGFHTPAIYNIHSGHYIDDEIGVNEARKAMKKSLLFDGMDDDFIESWIYSEDVQIATSKEMKDMYYVDGIVKLN